MKISRVLAPVVAGVLGISIFMSCDRDTSKEVDAHDNSMVTIENVDASDNLDALVKGDPVALSGMYSEYAVQQMVHEMSHQKVIADEKWGSIEMTQSRVEALLHYIQRADHLEHADVYVDILNRWAEGDFSVVDKDHNAIWNLQSGTRGKAYGIMSKKDEKKYVDTNFRD